MATRWDWRNGAGVLKDMAARTLLVKLEQRGLIELPARRQVPTNRMRCGAGPTPVEPPEPIVCALGELQPLSVEEVSGQPAERAWMRGILAQHHYLGFGGAGGQNLQYLVRPTERGPKKPDKPDSQPPADSADGAGRLFTPREARNGLARQATPATSTSSSGV